MNIEDKIALKLFSQLGQRLISMGIANDKILLLTINYVELDESELYSIRNDVIQILKDNNIKRCKINLNDRIFYYVEDPLDKTDRECITKDDLINLKIDLELK